MMAPAVVTRANLNLARRKRGCEWRLCGFQNTKAQNLRRPASLKALTEDLRLEM
jgi:hypothetical protein